MYSYMLSRFWLVELERQKLACRRLGSFTLVLLVLLRLLHSRWLSGAVVSPSFGVASGYISSWRLQLAATSSWVLYIVKLQTAIKASVDKNST